MSNQSFRCGSRSPAMRAGVFAVVAAMAAACLAGCSSDERANQMTSYSGKESKSETPALFTIADNQMSHVQVVTVEPVKLPVGRFGSGGDLEGAIQQKSHCLVGKGDRPAPLTVQRTQLVLDLRREHVCRYEFQLPIHTTQEFFAQSISISTMLSQLACFGV